MVRGIFTAARTARKISSQERKFAKQTGATALDDFLGGTAEVDVDSVVAEVFDHARGFGHDFGIGTEKLRRDGVLVFLELQIARVFGGASGNAFGAGELRHEETAAALGANDAAERGCR